MIILRRESNIIDIKEIKEAENKIINIKSIEINQNNSRGNLLFLTDFKILDDNKMVLNFDNQYV